MILLRYPKNPSRDIEAPSAFSLPKNIRKTPEYIEIFDAIRSRMKTILGGEMKPRILLYMVHIAYRVKNNLCDKSLVWSNPNAQRYQESRTLIYSELWPIAMGEIQFSSVFTGIEWDRYVDWLHG